MFFIEDRIDRVRQMILANSEEERRAALKEILPYQRVDYYNIFKAMNGYPVTIRLLDPPLHEFLPKDERAQRLLAEKLRKPFEEVRERVEALIEANPMLGFRGCRLGILYPEITEMQARAIMEAACNATKDGWKVFPEIMIPLVADVKELQHQADLVRAVAEKVFSEKGIRVDYLVGTMIEVPRAALLPTYLEKDIYARDPFEAIDQAGVGKLMKMASEDGRKAKPKLKLGICGEHGGETTSVEFCHRLGFDYVSCSPYRVPIARLAAA
ncbi:MAG: pyruvate, phosphate dikinase, partial [Gemmataceae bacterium]|nr:pyruvate, phosphate dikinase [Gemmataceae bacterium]